jgi:SAM-dependent methyltransferase
MLERAQARLSRLGRHKTRAHLLRGDMRRFALGRRFPLVLMAFNSFEHLYTRVEVAACLERVAGHLAPGGVFAFDVQNPDLRWLCRDPRKRWARTRFRHPETGERLVYTTNHLYDPVSQIALIRLYYAPEEEGGREKVVTLSQRKFFPAELEALLHAGGFRITERYGDFADEPLTGEAESQVQVCTVRPAS